MHIGITYNLPVDYVSQGFHESDASSIINSATLAAVSSALQTLGHKASPIGNVNDLIKKLDSGARWDLVFNLADGTYGSGREALVPSLLDAYQIPYTFSDPVTLAICTDKALTKRLIKDFGIRTADFFIVEKEEELDEVHLHLHYPVFIKPLRGGRSLGVNEASYIENFESLSKHCLRLLRQFKQPVLIESYLPGREFTVGVMGTGDDAQVIGIMEFKFNEKAEQHAYTRRNKVFAKDFIQHEFPEDIEALQASEIALKSWRALRCKDLGRIDIRSNISHEPYFLEANPIPGLHPEHSDIVILSKNKGMAYHDLIEVIIKRYIG